MTDLQPIETAPKDGKRVVVYEGGCPAIGYWYGGRWYAVGRTICEPTQWVPLPEQKENKS